MRWQGKTWRMVEAAVKAVACGDRVAWVHPKGSPPTGPVLAALTAAGVMIVEAEG